MAEVTLGVEATSPLADFAEACGFGGRQAGRLGVALMLPDCDVSLDLPDCTTLPLGHAGVVLAVLLAGPRGEPQDRVLVIDGRHRGERTDAADTVGEREAQTEAQERGEGASFDGLELAVGAAPLEVQRQLRPEVVLAELPGDDGRDLVGTV